ncbi:MAG: ATP-binding protein [Salinibacterium amurskyense]
MNFTPFDPLDLANPQASDAALEAMKRQIENILSSYVGWFDPFAELIQNGLDAVDKRDQLEKNANPNTQYRPVISIEIDIKNNKLTVTDNGVGMSEDEFRHFLAPSYSYKRLADRTRGHKGVGATYVAYGFNHMRVATKSPHFEAAGAISNARAWLDRSEPGQNPRVAPDPEGIHPSLATSDRGTSVTVHFDQQTRPSQLSWLKADTAATWLDILTVKTGLGSVTKDTKKLIRVSVLTESGTDSIERIGTGYLWLHESASKSARFREIDKKARELHDRQGANYKLPRKFSELNFIYETWTTDELRSLLTGVIDGDDVKVLNDHTPSISVEYGNSARLWSAHNKALGVRAGQTILSSGIQLAANDMPQGETIVIPLVRSIGRQNQIHFLIHFDNYTPDMGRKGFHRELTEFAKTTSKWLSENVLFRYRKQLKANTGAASDLVGEIKMEDWKKEIEIHEQQSPLRLTSPHFFLPTSTVSITSEPTREQDVIALFHELLAGGVVRGIQVMSTNERSTYDGLFKVSLELDQAIYLHHAETNPLGVHQDVLDLMHKRVTATRVLEYKYSLDGLVDDLDSNDKNIQHLDLCVAWEIGARIESRFGIKSLLMPENAEVREYHGVTHVLSDLETGNRHCDLIILRDMIAFLNDPELESANQRARFED